MLYKERTPKTNLRGSQSGGYLLSHNAVQYHRRCCVWAALPSPRGSAALAPLRPPPPVPRASDAFLQPHNPLSLNPTTTSPSWAITLRCTSYVCFIIGLSLNKVFPLVTSVFYRSLSLIRCSLRSRYIFSLVPTWSQRITCIVLVSYLYYFYSLYLFYGLYKFTWSFFLYKSHPLTPSPYIL